jgi:hypothetical protein
MGSITTINRAGSEFLVSPAMPTPTSSLRGTSGGKFGTALFFVFASFLLAPEFDPTQRSGLIWFQTPLQSRLTDHGLLPEDRKTRCQAKRTSEIKRRSLENWNRLIQRNAVLIPQFRVSERNLGFYAGVLWTAISCCHFNRLGASKKSSDKTLEENLHPTGRKIEH